MAVLQLQGIDEVQHSIVYEYDFSSTPIGVGGMGNVYAGTCRNLLTGAVREVAIKRLMPSLPAHIIEKARREASIRIKSDNLIEMIAFVETEPSTASGEPCYYIISELLHCVSLADIFKGRFNDFSGREIITARELFDLQREDPTAFTKRIITRVLSGMMALHDQGFIHRDIDPTNIVVTDEGHIKLIDFGICKHLGTLASGADNAAGTVQGTFIGKPEYAAPELIEGLLDSQSYSTDVYAMGILMYQCLTGELPFSGNRFMIMQKQRNMKECVPVKNIRDANMRAIVRKACEKKQEKRYQSATEMRYAIEKGSGARFSPFYLAAVAVLVAIILAVCWFVRRQDTVLSPEERFAEALMMTKSADTDSLRIGVNLMDSLARDGHIEAMYEMSCLYTYFKNDSSYQTIQQQLGIDPKSKEAQSVAQRWLKEVVYVSDSTHSRALYSLGLLYAKGGGELSQDLGKARRLFELAGYWALKNNDEKIATMAVNRMNICDSIIKINKQ